MKVAQKISEKLKDYMLRKDDLKIAGWRFNFQEGKAVSFGLKDNELCGPYVPASKIEKYIGEAYIRWADGRVSDAVINAPALENLDAAIETWRSISYNDTDAPDIMEPLPMPQDLKIKDDKVVDLIKAESHPYFFEILNFYNKELGKKDYTRTVQGEVNAKHLYVVMMNSEGLNLEWEETDIGTYAEVNSICGDGYHKRKMPEKKDLKRIIKEIDGYMIHSKKVLPVKQKKMPVIITPAILGQLMGHFIQSNLEGQVVANNQSPFSVEDFKTKKQVFDERINLVIDGLKDYSSTTQPCSFEGVPSTKQHVIANGRLITPLVDLKYAKKIGIPPTSIRDFGLDIQKLIPYSEMVKGIKYGLIVYEVLGMHTQDPKAGEYGLKVDQGLLIENGKIKGKVQKATINGNLFKDLKDQKTEFVDYRENEIAMQTKAKITT